MFTFMRQAGARPAVIALLQFDAWPIVDAVPGITTSVTNTTSSNIVASPTVGGSAGAFAQGGASTLWGVRTASPPPNTAHPLNAQAMTHELFVRRDGPTTIAAGEVWSFRADALVTDAAYTSTASMKVTLYNTPNSPLFGVARLVVQVVTNVIDETYQVNYNLPNAAYTHLAFVWSDASLRVFAAGVMLINVTLGGSLPADHAFDNAYLEMSSSTGEATNMKYVDSYRLSGGARYTTNFTPPTGPLTI